MDRIRKYLELARELRERADASAGSLLASQQLALADQLEQFARDESAVAANDASAGWSPFSVRRGRI
jgi:hypothetical protein